MVWAREAIEAYIESLVPRGLAAPEEKGPPRLLQISIAA
jgi:hypothetical protein